MKSKLPAPSGASLTLVSTKVIGQQIDDGISDFSWQGKRADHFNRITVPLPLRGQGQFNSPTNLP